jgi:hypothetical protein
MRIHDIINETVTSLLPGDPILSDPNLYRLLDHYVGKSFMEWAIENSPYNTSGRNLFQQAQAAAIKPIYNKIAAAIKPLAAEENPDINRIIKIIDSQIPMGGLPQNIKARVAQQQAVDAKTGWTFRPPVAAAATTPAPVAPSQSAEPGPAPAADQQNTVQVAVR